MQNYYESSISLSNNMKLSYTGYGDSNQNTVIFFHGFGSSVHAIHPDPTILDQHNIRFYALNRPGYGDSDIGLGYSMEDYADWLNEFLIAKNIQKASLIGWSAGGLYSQVFTDKYAEKVESLTLVSSAIPLNSEETKSVLPSNWKMIRNMNKYIPFMTKFYFKSLSKKVAKNLDGVIQESVKQMVEEDKKVMNNPTIQPAILKGTVEGYRNSGIGVYYDALALCNKMNESKNPGFNGKVHIWQGSADTIWTSDTSNFLKEKYTNSTYTSIDNGGHLLYLSHWDEILRKSVS
ncbi:alpha/beta fold hydrolase [Mesobacillus sp. S13]|uniref:alpha/beta fold hydrolase n=1 Tax=Mesobacillus sp. S13 TaxID=2880221 RepID=UPI001CF5BABF|nr:alpha/beta hydrolase [Mesobacillus sp. S13]